MLLLPDGAVRDGSDQDRVRCAVPRELSWSLLSGAALCVLSGIGIGTVIATFTHSAFQAQLTSFFVNPLLTTASGAITPAEAIPGWLQPLVQDQSDPPLQRDCALQHDQGQLASKRSGRTFWCYRSSRSSWFRLASGASGNNSVRPIHQNESMPRRIRQLLLAVLLLCQRRPSRQFGAPAGGSTGSQANQLPLSGRTGETGSVTAAQSPIAGTTNSVNTINPSIQVAGPYHRQRARARRRCRSPASSRCGKPSRAASSTTSARSGSRSRCGRRTGNSWSARSALMPNLNGSLSETVQQTDLRAAGLAHLFSFSRHRHSVHRGAVQLFRFARAPDADRGAISPR